MTDSPFIKFRQDLRKADVGYYLIAAFLTPLLRRFGKLEVKVDGSWRYTLGNDAASNARVQARAVRNGQIFHARGLEALGRNLSMRFMGERVMDVPWLYGEGPTP
jgi:hypothetical protein